MPTPKRLTISQRIRESVPELWAELLAQIQDHEGCRLQVYHDTLGYPTIGWGHRLGPAKPIPIGVAPMTCSQAQADQWFAEDIEAACAIWDTLARTTGLTEVLLPARVHCVGVEMCFQMGNRVSGFKNFLGALHAQKFGLAAVHMLDSAWHRQTPTRAIALAMQVADVNDRPHAVLLNLHGLVP